MTKVTKNEKKITRSWYALSPTFAFLLVSFCLGELGDGLNIFQGIYLVGIGWNEGSVGAALSLMGLTALVVQPFAGDWVDKCTLDRRVLLTIASIVTAISASTILFVRPGNVDHELIYVSKVLEGVASSFIGPCLAALTLAFVGPDHFDTVMASNILWGHVGSVIAAVTAGFVAYVSYPDIKYCFLVIGGSALIAILFIQSLPQGDPLMGRGFKGKSSLNEEGKPYDDVSLVKSDSSETDETSKLNPTESSDSNEEASIPEATSYMEVFFDIKTCILGLAGFFFHFANANVLLVLGELMGSDPNDAGGPPKRTAIPLTAGAIVTAQLTMTLATYIGGRCTNSGVGRKPLFMGALLSLPIRCALIILFRNAGDNYLLSTQILDGVGGGLFGLIHPLLVADITFGTGRFNVVSKSDHPRRLHVLFLFACPSSPILFFSIVQQWA